MKCNVSYILQFHNIPTSLNIQEKEKLQSFKDLGFITCVAVGDILNQNRNCLVVITADGWCHIYATYAYSPDEENSEETSSSGVEQV